jgi:hypothetical protein
VVASWSIAFKAPLARPDRFVEYLAEPVKPPGVRLRQTMAPRPDSGSYSW